MVLRCISTTSLHLGQKGLKTVFWKKFRKRKAKTVALVRKKRLTGDDEDVEEEISTSVVITANEQEKEESVTERARDLNDVEAPAAIVVSVGDFLEGCFVILSSSFNNSEAERETNYSNCVTVLVLFALLGDNSITWRRIIINT